MKNPISEKAYSSLYDFAIFNEFFISFLYVRRPVHSRDVPHRHVRVALRKLVKFLVLFYDIATRR